MVMRAMRFLGTGASAPKLVQWPASALTALYMLLKLGRPPSPLLRYLAVQSFISFFSTFTAASFSSSSELLIATVDRMSVSSFDCTQRIVMHVVHAL